MMRRAEGSGDKMIADAAAPLKTGDRASPALHRALQTRDAQMEPARRAFAALLAKEEFLLDDELRMFEAGALRFEYQDGASRIRWCRHGRDPGEMVVQGGELPSRLSPDERRRLMQLFAEEPETFALDDDAIRARVVQVRCRYAAWRVALAQELDFQIPGPTLDLAQPMEAKRTPARQPSGRRRRSARTA